MCAFVQRPHKNNTDEIIRKITLRWNRGNLIPCKSSFGNWLLVVKCSRNIICLFSKQSSEVFTRWLLNTIFGLRGLRNHMFIQILPLHKLRFQTSQAPCKILTATISTCKGISRAQTSISFILV